MEFGFGIKMENEVIKNRNTMGNEWSSIDRGIDRWSRRAELLKELCGAGSALSHRGFISSWRQPQEEVTSSLDQSMSHDAILFVFTDASSENNLRASLVWRCLLPLTQRLTDNNDKERLRIVFRPAGNFSHISFAFFFLIIKNHLAWSCYLKFQWNLYIFFFARLCSRQSGVPRD